MAHSIHIRDSDPPRRVGLDDWMARVAELAEKVRHAWHADDVHDLRTALRRCRTMAEGLSEVNPDPGWRRLKKSTRKLFRALGELRDAHVKLQWVKKLGASTDPLRARVIQILQERIATKEKICAEALAKFDLKGWRKLAKKLSAKAQFFPLESVVFQRLALARLNEAAAHHELARKGRSRIAWHRLRIGIKHFRYTLENFAPERGKPWLEQLKRMQDLLGDVHDLDILRRDIFRQKSKVDSVQLERWLELIEHRRARRLAEFSVNVGGKPAVWQIWRIAFGSISTLQLVPAFAAPKLTPQAAAAPSA